MLLRGTSRHNLSSIAMARMDTNSCFSEHSEHAPRWSDSKKHNDNNRTTLKNGFAKWRWPSSASLADCSQISCLSFSKFVSNTSKISENENVLALPHCFRNFSHFPTVHEAHSPQNVLNFQNITLFFASISMVFNVERISPTFDFRK